MKVGIRKCAGVFVTLATEETMSNILKGALWIGLYNTL